MPLLTKVEKKAEGSFLIKDQTRIAFALEPPPTYQSTKVYALESPPFKVRVRCNSGRPSVRSFKLDVPWCYFVAAVNKHDEVNTNHTSMWFATKKLDSLEGRVSMPPCLNILMSGKICHGSSMLVQSGPIENRLRQFFHHFWGSAFTPATSGMKLIPSSFNKTLIKLEKANIFAEWERMNREGKVIRWRGFKLYWRKRTIKTLGEAMNFTFRGY